MIPLNNNTINPTPRTKMYAPATTASTPDNTPETISKTILKILSTIFKLLNSSNNVFDIASINDSYNLNLKLLGIVL